MSTELEVFQVDAFTRRRFTGNPAGVVLGADGLDDATMLAIARELNNADTVFASAPDSSDHDCRVRFFTPRTEAGFVGHATLALHAVLARRSLRPLRRQKGRTGIVEVASAGDDAFEIRTPPSPLGRTLDRAQSAAVCEALGIGIEAMDPQCPPRVVGAGSTRLLFAVREGEALARLAPDQGRISALSAELGAPGIFVWSRSPALPDCDVESRMFAPALGIAEDPVSGNAHGMLAVYLRDAGLLTGDGLRGAQGHHLGRPGRVEAALLDDGRVAIRGEACLVFETRISLAA